MTNRVSPPRRHRLLLAFVVAAVLLRLLMAHQSVQHIPLTSDQAIAMLQAREFSQGRFKLFIMAQPYQFPLEAYMMAPLVRWLPPTILGARLFHFALGFLIFALMTWFALRYDPARLLSPALLLVLFPSAYLLMILYGYQLPSYTPAFLLWFLALLLTSFLPELCDGKSMTLVLAIGFSLGLAFTSNMVSLALAVPLVAMILMRPGWKQMGVHALCLACGIFAGLLPYLAGIWRYPDAQKAVAGTRPLGEAMGWLWSPTLRATLPGALGIAPPRFPDEHGESLALGLPLRPFFGVLFATVLLLATLRVLLLLLRHMRERSSPLITLETVVVGTTWLSLFLFVSSLRAASGEYRYLTPAAWCFPFLLVTAARMLPRRARGVGSALAVLLVVMNVITTLALMRAWSDPAYAAEVVHAPDLTPAMEWLQEHDFSHVVASHWTAYRLTLLSDEKIIAAQPVNERFPGWPLPYKEEVDAAPRAAYVLKPQSRFLNPARFEHDMQQNQVTAKMHQAGGFHIYYDFEHHVTPQGTRVDADVIEAHPSEAHELATWMLDGDPETYWRSESLQHEDMTIELHFSIPLRIRRIVLDHGRWGHDRPRQMRVEWLDEDGWHPIGEPVPGILDAFVWEHRRPIYGRAQQQTLALETPPASALRMIIHEPQPPFCWTLADVRVYAD